MRNTPSSMPYQLLLISDTFISAEAVTTLLRDHAAPDVETRLATSLDTVQAAMDNETPHLILISETAAVPVSDVMRMAAVMTRRVPVIVVTDGTDCQNILDLMRQGVRGFVEPADPVRFAQVIGQELTFSRFLNPGGTAAASTELSYQSRDITEREQQFAKFEAVTRSLETQRNQLARVLDTMQDAIICISLPDRKLVYVSASFENVLGVPVKVFLDDPEYFRKVVHPDDLEIATRAMRSVLTEGYTEVDHRIVLPDGSVRWLHRRAWVDYDANGQPIQVNDSALDITERKLAQEALKESEALHRAVLSNISDAVFVTDDEGAFTYICPNVHTLFGYFSSEVAVLGSITKLLGDQLFDLKRLDEEGEIANIEREVTDARGGVHDVLITVKRIQLPRGSILYSCRDITERKLTEQASHRQNQILQQSHDLIALGDIQGKITYINKFGAQLLGVPDMSFLEHKGITDFHTAEDAKRIFTEALPTAEAQGYWRGYNRLRTMDGRLIDVDQTIFPIWDASGKTTLYATIMIDIRERKRTEAAMRRSEARYRLLADHMADVVWILDPMTGFFSYVSPSVETLRGFTPDEALIQPMTDVMTADSIKLMSEGLPQRIQAFLTGDAEAVTQRHEIEQLCRDGSTVWTEVVTKLIYDGDGKLQILGVSHDISERRKAEADIGKLNRTLRLLSDVNELIIRTRSIPELFEKICQIAVAEGGYRMAWVGVLDRETLAVKPAASAGYTGSYLDTVNVVADDSPRGRGPGATVIRTGQHMLSNDIEHDDFMAPWRENAMKHGYRATAGLPVKVDGEVRCVVLLYAAEAGFFDAKEVQLLDEMVANISFAIEFAEQETRRQQAQEALRASEARYRQMFELHGLPKLIIDPDTGELIDANPAAAQFYGYDVETMRTMRIFDLSLAPADEIRIRMGTAFSAGMQSGEYVHRAAGNRPRDVEVFTGPIEINGQQYLYSVITDITEKNLAQAALQEANELLEKRVAERTAELENTKDRIEAIFNHSGDGILLLDIRQGIQQANDTFEALYGIQEHDYLGKTLSAFFHTDNDMLIDETIVNVVNQHHTYRIEARTRHAEGPERNVEISIAPVNRSENAVQNIVCIIRDITERKRAQQAMAEERQLLRTVIDTVPDFIYVKDTQHRIVLNNIAHARSLGVKSSEEVIGKDDYGLFSREMAAKFHADEAYIFETGQPIVNTEERSIGEDGSEIWAMTTKVPFRNLQGELTGLVGITHNVTAIKASEEALRKSEQQLREAQHMLQLVLDTIPVRVFWKNRDSTYMGCNILFAQDAGLDSTSAITGKKDNQLPWLAEHAAAFRADDLKVITSNTAKMDYEEPLRTFDGRLLTVETSKLPLRDSENKVIGVLGAYVDVTDRKQAETALRVSEERYRTTISTMYEGVMVQTTDGVIQLCNHAAERILGLSAEQMMGRTSLDDRWHAVHEDGTPFKGEEHPAMVTLRTGKTQSNVVMGVHKPDGSLTWILINAEPLTYEGEEQPYAVVATFADITERKQAEELLRQALMHEKELGELKSRFVSMASHEFRTPLAAILATTETLSIYRERMDKDQIEQRLNKIRQQVTHMKEIMEDVLQLARMQAGRVDYNPVAGDFQALCDEIVEEFESQTEYSGRLLYECKHTAVLTEFDPRMMRQVISNLVHNALKYSTSDKQVILNLSQTANGITLKVKDEGIGIPPEDFKYLFEPFHRAKNVGTISGTGLGLSITKQAVDAHKGTISVESEVDKGTTFTLQIP